jgi:hypothetical protein
MKPEPKKFYALHYMPTGGYLGELGEKYPVGKNYHLYEQSIAETRRSNCNHPEEWEVIVSPRQTDWLKEQFYQH